MAARFHETPNAETVYINRA